MKIQSHLEAGMITDKYTIGNILGNGAYSHVDEAIRKEDGAKFAIKVMSKNEILRSKRVKTAEIEYEVYSKVNHFNIVKFFDMYQDRLTFSLILEFVPNGTFSQFLKKNVSQEDIQHILAQVLLAISYLHQNGIIYRDLKPENILLDSNYCAKLCDFGSAKIYDLEHFEGYKVGSFVGTPDFLPPEILDDEPQTPACDLWGFGVLIYYSFTQQYPFYSPTNMLTYQKISSVDYSISDKIPVPAEDLIKNILRKDPTKR